MCVLVWWVGLQEAGRGKASEGGALPDVERAEGVYIWLLIPAKAEGGVQDESRI